MFVLIVIKITNISQVYEIIQNSSKGTTYKAYVSKYFITIKKELKE